MKFFAPSALARASAFALAAALAPAIGVTPARAAPVEIDLGQGLGYLRSIDIAEDLPTVETTLTTKPALVLDLRAARADFPTAKALRTTLAKPPAAKGAVRLVLVSESTSPTLLTAFAEPAAGVLTLGSASTIAKPDVSVIVSTDDDRKAFDALVSGTALEKLINRTLDKERFDEAKLVKEHASGQSHAPAAGEDDDAEDGDLLTKPAPGAATPAAPATPPAPEPPALVDRVLERAVQLHRTLLALKRL